jgi:hypothetical protein
LVLKNQLAQLSRYCEGDEEVIALHQAPCLALYPGLALMGLAVGAIAVAAGVGHHLLVATATALGQHAWRQGGAAALHGVKGLALGVRGALGVLGQVVLSKAINERGQRDHLTPLQSTQKRDIKAAIRSLA